MKSLLPKVLSAVVLTALVILVVPPLASPAELTAGIAVVDITPPAGYRMSGYFRERLNTGVRDPLHAKAIVLQQGEQRAALVFCDVIGLSLDVSNRARKLASEKTRIPASNILIAATHSHTGPLYFGALRKHFHDLAVARHGSDPHEKADYPAALVGKLVRVIAEAQAAARPVRLEAGTAKQIGLSFNRRFHMKDGSVRFNPGVLNPNIVRAAGPIDPDVGVVLVRDAAAGQPAAVLVNFALHLDTVGGTLYAADYPFHLEQSLRSTLGDEFVLLFGAGACGDINHIDVTRKARLKTETIGRTLAETILLLLVKEDSSAPPQASCPSRSASAILKVALRKPRISLLSVKGDSSWPRLASCTSPSRSAGLNVLLEKEPKTVRAEMPKLKPVDAPALGVSSTTVDAPLQQYSPAQRAQARKDMFKVGTRELPFLKQVEAYKVLALELRGGETIPLEVQVFRLGDDVAVVGLPGEVFVELGLAIKRASPFRTTLVIELCNDAPGYIPTKKAFAEGSYETVNSRVASGGGEQLVEAAIRLLNDLKSQGTLNRHQPQQR